jgi:hypothetical protein
MIRPTARIEIDAAIDVVWRIMLDTAAYGEWNPFIERVDIDGPPAAGTAVVLHVRWDNGKTSSSPERLTAVEDPAESDGVTSATLSYEFEGWPHRLGLVHSTRHQTLTQSPGGPTVYETVMHLSGPMVRFAGPARIVDGLERHAAGLKARAEQLHHG